MNRFLSVFLLVFLLAQLSFPGNEQNKAPFLDIAEIERRIQSYVPNGQYPDDPFILVAVQEALIALKENNGSVGACLVEESTGKIVERGHNRQFDPHFRSDLHAEMDLLTRYEERIQAKKIANSSIPQSIQRKVDGLVLYTSVEPCPMCLARIINSRISKTYYAAPDPTGGMAQRMANLPPFWQELASGNLFEPARCSPELVAIAKAQFRPMSKK